MQELVKIKIVLLWGKGLIFLTLIKLGYLQVVVISHLEIVGEGYKGL